MPANFFLDSRKSIRTEEQAIRVQISAKSTVLISTIGISINGDKWNGVKVTSATYKNAKGQTGKEINARLDLIKHHFSDWDLKLTERPTKDQVKQELKKALLKDPDGQEIPLKVKKVGFYERFEEFKLEQGRANGWAEATLKNWKTFKNHMQEFMPNLKFEFFDESGLNKYVAFLRNSNMEEKTVKKHYSCLKWFMNWALRKQYTRQDTILRYRPKFRVLEKPVIFLTKEELLHLYKMEIPGNGVKYTWTDMDGTETEETMTESGALHKTRDLFCFCAFTSLRYSDMATLRRTDIEGDIIYITTQKTNDRLPINLNRYAKEILTKYEKHHFPENLALPVITNQKMNAYLKTLGKIAGFNKPITITCYRGGKRVEETFPKYELIGTHAGRRTFICFALSSGIPPQVVMKWTGHSDYKAMKPYIDIAEKTKENAMALFEQELSK